MGRLFYCIGSDMLSINSTKAEIPTQSALSDSGLSDSTLLSSLKARELLCPCFITELSEA